MLTIQLVAARAHKCSDDTNRRRRDEPPMPRLPETHRTRCAFDAHLTPQSAASSSCAFARPGEDIWPRASTTLRWCSKDDGTIAATVVVYRAAIAALWSVGVSRRPQASKTRGKQLNRPGTVPRLDILVGPRSRPRKFALGPAMSHSEACDLGYIWSKSTFW
jgi:hypothetical protein